MKAVSIVLLIFGLQLAISPLCLCLGGGFDEPVATPSCCHSPEPEDKAPCPHCDQEMPLSTTTPGKASFEAEPPEWHGFPTPATAGPIAVLETDRRGSLSCSPGTRSGPTAVSLRELYGVFLI